MVAESEGKHFYSPLRHTYLKMRFFSDDGYHWNHRFDYSYHHNK